MNYIQYLLNKISKNIYKFQKMIDYRIPHSMSDEYNVNLWWFKIVIHNSGVDRSKISGCIL